LIFHLGSRCPLCWPGLIGGPNIIITGPNQPRIDPAGFMRHHRGLPSRLFRGTGRQHYLQKLQNSKPLAAWWNAPLFFCPCADGGIIARRHRGRRARHNRGSGFMDGRRHRPNIHPWCECGPGPGSAGRILKHRGILSALPPPAITDSTSFLRAEVPLPPPQCFLRRPA